MAAKCIIKQRLTERDSPETKGHKGSPPLLPKIDPMDKGMKKIEEEMNLKVNLMTSCEKHQEQEREQFTIEERAKFLHDTIAAQRKFLAQQRSEAIRNIPLTKNQLRKSNDGPTLKRISKLQAC
ncbi:hypothetical protein Tco_0740600 [Tanacetum coccineum]